MERTIKDSIIAIEHIMTAIITTIMTMCFMLIFLIVFTLVLLRYVFSQSLFGGAEVVTVLFIYASAIGASLLFRNRNHIRIVYFLQKLPYQLRKCVILSAYVVNILFHVQLLLLSFNWIAVTGFYRTAILKVPHWVMQASIPIYSSIVILYVSRNILLVLLRDKYIEHESTDNNLEFEEC